MAKGLQVEGVTPRGGYVQNPPGPHPTPLTECPPPPYILPPWFLLESSIAKVPLLPAPRSDGYTFMTEAEVVTYKRIEDDLLHPFAIS